MDDQQGGPKPIERLETITEDEESEQRESDSPEQGVPAIWPSHNLTIYLTSFVIADPDWPDGLVCREHRPSGSKVRNPSWKQVKWVMRSVGRTDYRGQRAERRSCLGVLQCSSCKQLVRPKTQQAARDAQISGICPNRRCKKQDLEHLSCQAYTLHWSEGDSTEILEFWEHHGIHGHPRPPGGSSLTKAEQDALDNQVSRRPDASAHQLRTGTTAPGSVPLGNVAPTLADSRKARYEVGKSQERQGIQTKSSSKQSGFGFIAAVAKLETDKLDEGFLMNSSCSSPAYYISLQSKFMKQVLHEAVDDWILASSEGPGAGRHGFVTDGDHTFFRSGTLLATCAFNVRTNTWAPVLYTWVYHLDTAHHKVHFRNLNRCVIEAAGPKFDRKMLINVRHMYSVILRSYAHFGSILITQIMDFSQPQRSAHEQAFAEAVITTLVGWASFSPAAQTAQHASLLEEAQEYQRGCDTHFKRSGRRLKQDGKLVAQEDHLVFDEFMDNLLSTDATSEEFDDTVRDFRNYFPQLDGWISWWIRPKFASMIFPAKRVMNAQVAQQIPHTSNAIEAQHSLLHHALGTRHDLLPGIEKIQLHVRELETKYNAIQGTVTVVRSQ